MTVRRLLVVLGVGSLLSGLVVAWVIAGQPRPPDVPYVPTPQPVVEEMLKIAQVTSADVVYDLGCGDGRIVVTAASKFGARGVGVDIDPQRIKESKENAQKARVTDKTKFILGDLFELDLRPATVVTLYLLPSINIRLRPKLFRELAPGTRVVSHDFDMDEWEADETRSVDGPYRDHTIYYWVIPASVGGIWEWTVPTAQGQRTYTARLRQHFQKLYGTVSWGRQEQTIRSGKVTGHLVAFEVQTKMNGQAVKIAFSGKVNGDSLIGTVDISGGPLAGKRDWKATRKPGKLTGRWRFGVPSSAGGGEADLIVQEEKGSLSGVLSYKGRREQLEQFYVWGTSIYFTANGEGASRWAVSGLAEGDRMTGTFQFGSSDPVPWTAERVIR